MGPSPVPSPGLTYRSFIPNIPTVKPRSQVHAASLAGLLVLATALAFLIHDGHDRAKAETCHICCFQQAGGSAILPHIDIGIVLQRTENLVAADRLPSSTDSPRPSRARAPPVI